MNLQSPTFCFGLHSIRVGYQDEQIWFSAADICAALGIRWNGKTLASIPKEWQGLRKLLNLPNSQPLRVISEPAVYKLAFRSNKPEADAFTNWVASEVLPAIRKTGSYSLARETERPALPASPDCNDDYRRMREDLRLVSRLVRNLSIDIAVRAGTGYTLVTRDTALRINAAAERCLCCLDDATRHLSEANELMRRLM